MANIKDCFIESHKLFYSKEMECSFGYSCLCPTERVLNGAPCGLYLNSTLFLLTLHHLGNLWQ